MLENRSLYRLPLLGLAIFALLMALWAGWVRLGWQWPIPQAGLVQAHGALMVGGFLGTLIALERCVALGQRWMYAGPLLSGLGGLALILGVKGPVGPALITLASLWLVAIFLVIVRRFPALHTRVMAFGALAWLVGNLLWLAGFSVHRAVLWWAGFLILTIAGERLELGRLLRLSRRVETAFVVITELFLLGLLLSVIFFLPGVRLAALALLALAAWLLRFDIARLTIRQAGLPRFVAVCLLAGYVWLGISALLILTFGITAAGPRYDAVLHSLFLGFVMSMIFGHAPIIFPAILQTPVRYSPMYYAHLALLHLSLASRVGGDLVNHPGARLWGGLFNGFAILLFLSGMAWMVANTQKAAARDQKVPLT